MSRRRTIHFQEDPAEGRVACGARGDITPLGSAVPSQVTCAHLACRSAAEALVIELRELAALAVGARLVFLDFDGVLNHVDHYKTRAELRQAWCADRLTKGLPPAAPPAEHFDRACVARLNRLLEVSGALVVVSSTWRLGSTPRRLTKLLGGAGFTGTIIGTTPELSKPRGCEITTWLAELQAPPRSFVVIDDDSDMDGVEHAFVQTSFQGGGLTDEKVEEALRVLGVDGGSR